jgi:hypothetical protein
MIFDLIQTAHAIERLFGDRRVQRAVEASTARRTFMPSSLITMRSVPAESASLD